MKILLLYTNRNRHLAPPPVGLAYLIPPLQAQGHEVQVLDLMFSKQPHQDLEKALAAFGPELAGFSIRNLDNQYMLDLKNPLAEIKELVAIARRKGMVTVLGGTAFTTFPREMLQFMEADYGIAGQGEVSLPLLVRALETGQTVTGIPGLVFRNREIVTANPPVLTGYAWNTKADWRLINMKLYKKKALMTPAAAVLIKTGCPYECSFCDAKASMGNQFIFRDIDQIIAELKTIQKLHNLRWFFLNSICFNAPLDYAKQLLRGIIAANLKIRFMCRLYPIRNSFDDEFFELYRQAGGYFTMIDFNSFSERMLENYHKPFTIEDIYHFGQMANKHGLKFGVELLFGGPGETNETIKESMAFLPEINYSLLTYAIGVRISPHVPLFEIAKQEGQINDSSELLFSKFYVSRDFDLEWAKKYIAESVKRYSYRNRQMLPIILRNAWERLA